MSSSSSLSCQDSRAPATQASDSVAALVERDAGTRGGRMLEVSDDVSMGVRSLTCRDALSMQLAKQAVHAAVGPRQACCGAHRMERRATRVDGRKGVAVQLLGVRAVPEGGSLSCGHVVWEHGRARVPITTTPDRGQHSGSGAPAAGNRSERVICERIMGGRRPRMARMHARRLPRACWRPHRRLPSLRVGPRPCETGVWHVVGGGRAGRSAERGRGWITAFGPHANALAAPTR